MTPMQSSSFDHLRSCTEGEAVRAATEAGDRARAASDADGVSLTDVRIGDGDPVYAIQDGSPSTM